MASISLERSLAGIFARLWLSRERLQPSQHPVTRDTRATHDEDRIVAADCTKDVRPVFSIESRSDRLRSPRNSTQDDHVADAIDSKEELRQKRFESYPALLHTSIGDRVSRALRCRNTSEPELTQVSRQCRLCDVPPAVKQQLSKILLAADK